MKYMFVLPKVLFDNDILAFWQDYPSKFSCGSMKDTHERHAFENLDKQSSLSCDAGRVSGLPEQARNRLVVSSP